MGDDIETNMGTEGLVGLVIERDRYKREAGKLELQLTIAQNNAGISKAKFLERIAELEAKVAEMEKGTPPYEPERFLSAYDLSKRPG